MIERCFYVVVGFFLGYVVSLTETVYMLQAMG